MGLEIPLSSLQQPATCPCLEPDQTNPRPSVLFFEDPLLHYPTIYA